PMSWGASVPQSPPVQPAYAPPREPPPLRAQAKPTSAPSLMIEEPEFLDEADVVEEDEEEVAARSIPSLEAPRPPTAAQVADRAKVDVWALAESDDEETQVGVREEG